MMALEDRKIAGVDAKTALWMGILTIASVASTVAFECAVPFAALAALAALTMRRRDALGMVALVWLASVTTGFLALGYPVRASSIAWTFFMLGGALAGAIAAQMIAERTHRFGPAVMALAALAGAYASYKVAILLGYQFLGGGERAFAPDVLLLQVRVETAFLVGLMILHRAVVLLGVMPPSPATSPRLARP
jgi:hypothetical protein